MSTLILPCAGRSSRFPDMKPKWMLTHPDGDLMIEKAIRGFDLQKFSRIIVTIVKEHAEKYEAELILKQVFSDRKVEVLVLDSFTKCQADTVLETLVRKEVHGNFVVKDSDNFLRCVPKFGTNFVVGLNITKFDREVFRLRSKSFLLINDQNEIVDIVEKNIKSEIICLGVYGFQSVEKYISAYQSMKNERMFTGETYLSHIISYMIGVNNEVFHYCSGHDFEDWGTLEDWRTTQRRYRTYFVDIDGVVFKNRGKYGSKNWSNDNEIIASNLDLLRGIVGEGGQIIFTTSRGEEYRELLERVLEQNDIKYHAIVMGCHHAARVIINDFAPTNPFPSCTAISVPRDANLSLYIER